MSTASFHFECTASQVSGSFDILERLLVRMNSQQFGQPRSSNGFGRRKADREGTTKTDNKVPSGKSNASRSASTGELLELFFSVSIY